MEVCYWNCIGSWSPASNFFFKPKKWTLPEGIQIAKNFYYQTAKTITFSNSIFCSRKFCHNRKKIPLGVALQLLNLVATIFSPGLRIHGTYMVGMINGPLGFALYYIHYRLSTYTYVVESCRPPLVISSVGVKTDNVWSFHLSSWSAPWVA